MDTSTLARRRHLRKVAPTLGTRIKARMTCSGLTGSLVPLNGFVTKLRKLFVLSDESVNGVAHRGREDHTGEIAQTVADSRTRTHFWQLGRRGEKRATTVRIERCLWASMHMLGPRAGSSRQLSGSSLTQQVSEHLVNHDSAANNKWKRFWDSDALRNSSHAVSRAWAAGELVIKIELEGIASFHFESDKSFDGHN